MATHIYSGVEKFVKKTNEHYLFPVKVFYQNRYGKKRKEKTRKHVQFSNNILYKTTSRRQI